MKEPRWIELLEVLVLHDIQLSSFGGGVGIRDVALLESALARPKNIWNYDAEAATMPRLAAAYAFGIVKNHPFVDGNKRTGLIVAFTFVERNGLEVTASEEETYQKFIDLASGKLTENKLAKWIEQHSR